MERKKGKGNCGGDSKKGKSKKATTPNPITGRLGGKVRMENQYRRSGDSKARAHKEVLQKKKKKLFCGKWKRGMGGRGTKMLRGVLKRKKKKLKERLGGNHHNQKEKVIKKKSRCGGLFPWGGESGSLNKLFGPFRRV